MGKKKKTKSSKTNKKKTETTKKQQIKEPATESILESALKSAKKTETQPSFDTSFDAAMQSTQNTQTDLQGLLSGISEGKDYYHSEKKEEMIPHLSYDSKSEISDYEMEDVPISEWKTPKKPAKKSPAKKAPAKKAPAEKAPAEKAPAEKSPVKDVKLPTQSPTRIDIYGKLELFFTGYINSYNNRYDEWESSISNILAIMRKMRKITKKNAEDLVSSIKNSFKKIETNLQQFKVKRDETEKVAKIDLLTMSGKFKKVLGLLELQVKDYQLRKITDEYIREQGIF